MGKKDFDNLVKIFKQGVTLAAGGTISTELDFDIPRGFIVKILDITLQFMSWNEDLEGIVAGEYIWAAQGALIRDPDDTTTIQIPAGSVQHDVLMETQMVGYYNSTVAEISGPFITGVHKTQHYNEEDDVISARNLRLNVVGQGNDVAILTETALQAEVRYRYEEVKDADLLNILDIL